MSGLDKGRNNKQICCCDIYGNLSLFLEHISISLCNTLKIFLNSFKKLVCGLELKIMMNIVL